MDIKIVQMKKIVQMDIKIVEMRQKKNSSNGQKIV